MIPFSLSTPTSRKPVVDPETVDRGVMGLTAIPVVIIGVLLLVVFWLSLIKGIPYPGNHRFTLENFSQVYGSSVTWSVLANTLIFSAVAVAVSMVLGVGFSWLVERTDFPSKRLVTMVMMMALLIPGFFPAMGWLFLLGPKIGVVNLWLHQLFGLRPDFITVTSPVGMGFVQGLLLTSLAFIMFGPSFRALSSQMLEVAEVHGLSSWRRFWHVEIPLMIPALLSTSIYVFMVAVASFDVPAIMGLAYRVFTFSSYIYEVTSPLNGVPVYGQAAALALVVMLAAGILTAVYQKSISRARIYQVIGGREYRTHAVRLGRWSKAVWVALGGYIALAMALPLLLVIWVSLMPYFQAPSAASFHLLTVANFTQISWTLVWVGLKNTLILMLVVPSVIVVFALLAGWLIVRSRSRWRRWVDIITFLPHAVPNIVFAVALQTVALFMVGKWLGLAGTVWIIALVYFLVFLAFAVRSMSVAIIQISGELEESAFVGGMSVLGTLRHVIVPVIETAVRNAWLWVALLVFRELTMAVVLLTSSNLTLPTVVWTTFYSGKTGESAAISLIFMVLFLPLMAWYMRITLRREG